MASRTALKVRTVKVLSVKQPFASAFFHPDPAKRKPIENRRWRTKLRGRLFIHASSLARQPTADELAESCDALAIKHILAMWTDPPAPGLRTGAIIGSVNLWEIVDGETLELLSMTPPGATSLPEDVRRCLYPSQRDGWLDRWRHVRERMAGITEAQFLTHFYGPECWLVDQPKLLKRPVPTKGRLNLWPFALPVSAE